MPVLSRFFVFPALVLVAASSAHAQAAPAGGANAMLMNMVPILFMLGVFYFLIMRPQMRKQKELQDFLGNLKHGDAVVTASGMLGVIREIQGGVVTLEVSQGVRVKFLKTQIANSADVLSKAADKAEVKA